MIERSDYTVAKARSKLLAGMGQVRFGKNSLCDKPKEKIIKHIINPNKLNGQEIVELLKSCRTKISNLIALLDPLLVHRDPPRKGGKAEKSLQEMPPYPYVVGARTTLLAGIRHITLAEASLLNKPEQELIDGVIRDQIIDGKEIVDRLNRCREDINSVIGLLEPLLIHSESPHRHRATRVETAIPVVKQPVRSSPSTPQLSQIRSPKPKWEPKIGDRVKLSDKGKLKWPRYDYNEFVVERGKNLKPEQVLIRITRGVGLGGAFPVHKSDLVFSKLQ